MSNLSSCILRELSLYVLGETGDEYPSSLLDRILFVYIFLIIQTLLTVLYTLYLCNQDWFFIPASHEEDDVEANGEQLEQSGDERDGGDQGDDVEGVGDNLDVVERQDHFQETRSLENHSNELEDGSEDLEEAGHLGSKSKPNAS